MKRVLEGGGEVGGRKVSLGWGRGKSYSITSGECASDGNLLRLGAVI